MSAVPIHSQTFTIKSSLLVLTWGPLYANVRRIGINATIALAMMMVGSIGMGVAPPKYFGIVERFSVFAAVGFNAVLGLFLFNGFRAIADRSMIK